MVRLVIFDLDGTLYSYEQCNERAERQLREAMAVRLDVSDREARSLLKEAREEVKGHLGNVAASHNRLLYMQRVCEKKGVNPLPAAMELYDVYWDAMLNEMELFPYVLPLFRLLRDKGVRIGVLTDLTAHIQYRKIKKLEIEEYIDYFTSSEEAGEDKPSGKIFRKMMEKTPFRPEETLMVGDSRERDVEGARACGMKAILYEGQADMAEEVGRFL